MRGIVITWGLGSTVLALAAFQAEARALSVICAALSALLCGLAVRDTWRVSFAVLLSVMVLYSSSLEFSGVFYYPRFLALALFCFVAWSQARARRAVRFASWPPAARGVVTSLWIAVGVAWASCAWSQFRLETALQSLVFTLFVVSLQGTLGGRWVREPRLVISDLAVSYYVMATFACIGLGMDAFAFGNTRTFNGNRFQGIFYNPNFLAMAFAIMVPLGVALLIRRQWMAGLAAVPLLASLVMAQSRTAFVAIAIGLAWQLVGARGAHRVRILVLMVCTSILGILLSAVLPNAGIAGLVLGRFERRDGGDLLNSRSTAWGDAIALFEQRPIGGYGFGASPSVFESLQGLLAFGKTSVHNSYLQFVVELGFVGILVLVALFIAWGRVIMNGAKVGEFVLASVVPIGIAVQFTESAMFGFGQVYPYLFWFMVAGASVAKRPLPVQHGSGVALGR